MAQDHEGNELKPGDVVAARFTVTNIVADSERLNLVVKHFDKHYGLSDDFRLQFSSRSVVLVSSAPAPAPEPLPELAPSAAVE